MADTELSRQGLFLNETGISECIESGKKSNELLKFALDLDLKDYGLKCLPDTIKSKQDTINGQFILQIQKIRNVSSSKENEDSHAVPPLYRLSLTDGHSNCSAIELDKISNLSLNTPPGTKIRLHGLITVQNSFLLLNNKNSKILGGRVDKLIDNWQIKRTLAKQSRTNTGEGGPPPFLPFGKKVSMGSASRGSVHKRENFKSLSTGKEKVRDEGNEEFEQQRQATIANILQRKDDARPKSFGLGSMKQGNEIEFGGGSESGFNTLQAQSSFTHNSLPPSVEQPRARYNDVSSLRNENSNSNHINGGRESSKRDMGKERRKDRRDGRKRGERREPREETHSRDSAHSTVEAPKGRRRRGRDEEASSSDTKPSAPATLFDFLSTQMPETIKEEKPKEPPSERKPAKNVSNGEHKSRANPSVNGERHKEEDNADQKSRGPPNLPPRLQRKQQQKEEKFRQGAYSGGHPIRAKYVYPDEHIDHMGVMRYNNPETEGQEPRTILQKDPDDFKRGPVNSNRTLWNDPQSTSKSDQRSSNKDRNHENDSKSRKTTSAKPENKKYSRGETVGGVYRPGSEYPSNEQAPTNNMQTNFNQHSNVPPPNPPQAHEHLPHVPPQDYVKNMPPPSVPKNMFEQQPQTSYSAQYNSYTNYEQVKNQSQAAYSSGKDMHAHSLLNQHNNSGSGAVMTEQELLNTQFVNQTLADRLQDTQLGAANVANLTGSYFTEQLFTSNSHSNQNNNSLSFNEQKIAHKTHLKPGDYCECRWEDGQYYQAIIQSFSQDKTMCLVQFPEYGSPTTVPTANIRPLMNQSWDSNPTNISLNNRANNDTLGLADYPNNVNNSAHHIATNQQAPSSQQATNHQPDNMPTARMQVASAHQQSNQQTSHAHQYFAYNTSQQRQQQQSAVDGQAYLGALGQYDYGMTPAVSSASFNYNHSSSAAYPQPGPNSSSHGQYAPGYNQTHNSFSTYSVSGQNL